MSKDTCGQEELGIKAPTLQLVDLHDVNNSCSAKYNLLHLFCRYTQTWQLMSNPSLDLFVCQALHLGALR